MLIGMSKKCRENVKNGFERQDSVAIPTAAFFFSLSLSLFLPPLVSVSLFSPSLSYANHQDDQPTLHIIIPVRKMGTDGPVGLRMGLRMRMSNDIHT